jgi:hypothetical protein
VSLDSFFRNSVINVFRPFISPCEAVNFDNWPALCTFCGMKQKLYKEGPSENWKSINDNLLKSRLLFECDDKYILN